MRHYRIMFFDGASIETSATKTPGFMEVDDDGNFVRLADVNGNTYTRETIPPGSYTTLDFEPVADKPAWGV